MKQCDLKVIRKGNLRCIFAYLVRFKFKDSENIYYSNLYFDIDKANSLCNDVLSKNKKIDFYYVDVEEIFL